MFNSIQFKEALSFFVHAMAEMAVLFVGISFFVGILMEYLPAERVKKLLSGKGSSGYILGAILGGLTPFCSCSTIPVTIGLLRAKAGFGPTMSFLFTSPLVNPVLISIFIITLGVKASVVYAVLAISLAILSGVLLQAFGFQRFIRLDAFYDNEAPLNEMSKTSCCSKEGPEPVSTCCSNNEPEPVVSCCSKKAPEHVSACCSNEKIEQPAPTACCSGSAAATSSSAFFEQLTSIFRSAVKQFTTFLPYIVLGVAIGAFVHGYMPQDMIVKYAGGDNLFSIPVAAFLGVPLYIRASTMLPIAGTLIAKGMGVGTVIALIVGGAGASLPEVIMLKRLFRWQLLLAFLTCVFFIAISSGLVFQLMENAAK